jgi:hypothetical protein
MCNVCRLLHLREDTKVSKSTTKRTSFEKEAVALVVNKFLSLYGTQTLN